MRALRSLSAFFLALAASAALAAKPVVIAGKASLPNDGERAFAASLSRHAARWLREAGLETDVADDSDLASALRDRKVAMLVYCAKTTPAQDKAVSAFLARGGKLIVCYSSSPTLAALMGVSLGQYKRDDAGGRWARMRFDRIRPVNLPGIVAQSSPNIHAASPRSRATRVLAWWEDRSGANTGDAAWLASDGGYWMTHVLLADGDASAKGQMLLALFAACDPSLWRAATDARIAATAEMPPYKGTANAAAAAGKIADPARREKARKAAADAATAESTARKLLKDGRGDAAWLVANDWRKRLSEVYGYAQEPRKGEIRGVWDHSGQGLYPGDWPRTCKVLKDAGISDIFVNVAGIGFAHCNAAGIPPSQVRQSEGDVLAKCVAAAHAQGIRVHAWFLCFSTTGASPERMAELRKKGWLLKDGAGKERPWIDPANAEARKAVVAAVTDIAARYPVDGVHLDFVRYPDFDSALGASSKAAFEKAIGRKIAQWPVSVNHGGALRKDFMAWRARQVSSLVSETRSAMRAKVPRKWLTAAVYGKYPSCVDAVGQAWETWIEQGTIDYAVPMNYTENDTLLSSLLKQQGRSARLRAHTLSGVGVTAAESRLDAAGVIGQVRMARDAGLHGFVLFDLDTTLEQDILPILSLGLTAGK